ncbi:MAG: hypothetical protein R6W92_12825 [Desulfocurvibacter africanus]
MASSKYSLLLMRDDSQVRRFRVSKIWLKAFIYAEIFLVALALAGFFTGYRFWLESHKLRVDNRNLQITLTEARVKLERLENVEQILQSNDPDELHALIGSVSVETESPQIPSNIDLNEIFTHVDLQQANVDNFQARLQGDKLQVRFDLNNLVADSTLSGVVHLAIITRTGQLVQPTITTEDLNFSIQRFKRVRTVFGIPSGIKGNDLFGIRLNIRRSDNGTMVFSETFPLSQILS